MLSFFIDYIILSCLFNLAYTLFEGDKMITEYISLTQNKMISDLKEKEPSHSLLKELLDSQRSFNQAVEADTPFLLKLIRDLIFFPLNLLVISIIILDKLTKKIMD